MIFILEVLAGRFKYQLFLNLLLVLILNRSFEPLPCVWMCDLPVYFVGLVLVLSV